MKKINRKKLIMLIDEMAKESIVYDKVSGSITIYDHPVDEGDHEKDDVEIFQYEQSRKADGVAPDQYEQMGLVFKSNAMKRTMDIVEAVAKKDTTVLLQGETGTGKSLIAKMIHAKSDRKDSPFMDINCAAIPEKLLESELFGYEAGSFTGASENGKQGLFEAAEGGTVFLDEINSLPLSLQVKFLRVIQEREIMRVGDNRYTSVDIRVVVATNEDLLNAVEHGTFREDLYYRLNVVPVTIEPLRKRKEDVRILGKYFLDIYNRQYGQNKDISKEGWLALEHYRWPGNIRELENMIERLSIIADREIIERNDIVKLFSNIESDEQFKPSLNLSLKEQVGNYEKMIIETRLKSCRSISELAHLLGIDKSTLTRKIKKYGIKSSKKI